ncbi:DgyrCDS11591 [Dimorphilus gyrociliatus]|uniref:DgyrCDS11591 n=1 Tax=Dimorphilus gyrociliatus TaxID=2664684 RepID=A0A7I8W4Q9_9ANNE|nr:DgyrCDS11591 [Dimorphilus gyrociliatus]
MAAPIKFVRSAYSLSFLRKQFISDLKIYRNYTRSYRDQQKSTFSFWTNSKTRYNLQTSGVIVSGVCSGLAIGYGIFSIGNYRKSLQANATEDKIEHLDHPITYSVKSDTDNTGLKLTLYQYATCPFCCKVRAYLDFHGFSYDVVEVNSVTRKELKWAKKYRKVPMLIVEQPSTNGYVQLKDSSVIMSTLETFLLDRRQKMENLVNYYPCIENKEGRKLKFDFPNKYFVMYGDDYKAPGTEETRKVERHWRKWADETLVHTLSPNVYRTPSEALQAFTWFSETGNWKQVFSNVERIFVIYVGAVAMYFVGKMLKKRHELPDDVRQALYSAVADWTKEIGKKPFHGGNRPDLADLSTFGYLSAIEGCWAFGDLLKETQVKNWYNRMKASVHKHEVTCYTDENLTIKSSKDDQQKPTKEDKPELCPESCSIALNGMLSRLKQAEDEINILKDQYSPSGNIPDAEYATTESIDKKWKEFANQLALYQVHNEEERTKLLMNTKLKIKEYYKEFANSMISTWKLAKEKRSILRRNLKKFMYLMKHEINIRLDNFQFILSTSLPRDCSEVQRNSNGKPVAICPSGSTEPFITKCVKDGEGNLWTVIQKRTDSKVNFNRTWIEYKYGFRSTVDLWMGLMGVQRLTENQRHILSIHMKTDGGRILWAEYDNFTLTGSEYRLGLGNYKGNATNALSFNEGSKFGTFDRILTRVNYPLIYYRGWWLRSSYPGTYSDLNGQMIWFDINLNEHLKIVESQMAIRPWNNDLDGKGATGESGDSSGASGGSSGASGDSSGASGDLD